MTMTIRGLEFYSGIGGLHIALKASNVPASVIRAFDWDQMSCQVYNANHGDGANIAQRIDISTLTAASLAHPNLNASLWLLSPSCQPYTVLNPDAKGDADPRAQSFLHLVRNVIPELVRMGCAPRWLLVENVAGFETSSTRDTLISTLESNGYNTLELLLTPVQFGIPNSRLRYYLLAKARPLAFAHAHVLHLNNEPKPETRQTQRRIPSDKSRGHDEEEAVAEIRNYLDPPLQTPTVWADHPCRVPDRVLEKWGRLFDIVLPSSRRTCCFTRGYTRMVERTGSILQMNEDLDTTKIFDEFLEAQGNEASSSESQTRPVTILQPLKLRYFSPDELLRLFHFTPPVIYSPTNRSHPKVSRAFVWPTSVSEKAKYRLIGNSVNVEVVSRLIEYLFLGDDVHTHVDELNTPNTTA